MPAKLPNQSRASLFYPNGEKDVYRNVQPDARAVRANAGRFVEGEARRFEGEARRCELLYDKNLVYEEGIIRALKTLAGQQIVAIYFEPWCLEEFAEIGDTLPHIVYMKPHDWASNCFTPQYRLGTLEKGLEDVEAPISKALLQRNEQLMTSTSIGVQQFNRQAIRSYMTQLAARPSPSEVLQTYRGFVNELEGDIAHVTLTSEEGETYDGEYPAKKLAEHGICGKTAFMCQLVQMESGGYNFVLTPEEFATPSKADQEILWNEIQRAVSSEQPAGS